MESETLHKIDDALMRLGEGTFGYCEKCGEEISGTRLRALPFASCCKGCQDGREVVEQRVRQFARRRPGGFLLDVA